MTSPAAGDQPPMGAERPDLVLIVGQLLEATKAASSGLRAINAETRQNSQAIIRAAQTLEITEKLVIELNRIVRLGSDSGPSLMMAVHTLTKTVNEQTRHIARIRQELGEGETRMNAFDRYNERSVGMRRALEIGGILIFNLLTLGVALYAALRSP